MRMGKKALGAIGALLFAAAPALADVASFTYSDLDGDFVSGSSTFTASNASNSAGDVTRLVGGTTSSIFDFDGGGIGSAAFNITMSISGITATTADGTGTLTITDVDGDKFTADINGDWEKVGSSGSFAGLLSNFIPDDSGGNGTFDGNVSGSFLMDFSPASPPFEGNIITLAFGGWFSDGAGDPTSFSNKTTLASGAVAVPSPGAALLGLIGMGLVGRMKRKVA